MLIGIAGKKGAGKDTSGNIISNLTNISTDSFARPIKEISKELFNWDENDVNGAFKETVRRCHIQNWKTKLPAVLRTQVHEFKSFNDYDLIKLFKIKILRKVNKPWYRTISFMCGNLTIDISPRQFMQLFGTNFARTINDNIWINKALENINETGKIITDVRFNNEAEAIIAKGGKIIKIHRDIANKVEDSHLSETGIRKDLISTTILNNGSKEELQKAIELAMDLVICPKRIL